MRQYKNITAIALLAAGVLASCSKQDNGLTTPQAEVIEVSVAFGEAQAPGTRGFMDEAAETWPWEKAIDDLTLTVYSSSGDLLVSQQASTAEISAGRMKLPLPAEANGQTCGFYAVANAGTSYTAPAMEEALKNGVFNQSAEGLNGTAEQVTAGTQSVNRFLMSGSVRSAVEVGSPVSLSIPLKRAASKVALRFRVSPDMETTHPDGTLHISSVKLCNVPHNPYIIESNAPRVYDDSRTVDVSQPLNLVDGWYEQVFYAYESDLTGDRQMQIEIVGYFDRLPEAAGNRRVWVSYTIPVNAQEGGCVRRNTCYRLTGEIVGLGVTEIRCIAQIVPWVTADHNLEVGS